MITSFQPSKFLLLILAAALVWVGLIFLAFAALSGITFSTTWIAAGAVFFAILAWVLVMIREIQDSVKMPIYRAVEGELSGDFKRRTESVSRGVH